MAYGIVQFLEGGQRKVTLVRPRNGQPTGEDGLMDPLSQLIEYYSPLILREGSPGAEKMAMLFFAREQEAGRPTSNVSVCPSRALLCCCPTSSCWPWR